MLTASDLSREQVAAVLDDPRGRLALLRSTYDGQRPYRRAASVFMRWELRRGLLDPLDAPVPGSPWWRALNERLLLDSCEAHALAVGHPGTASTPGVRAGLAFLERPSARRWYRAHNASIVSAYLDHEDLAHAEGRPERFFINLVLVRLLYAHALVASPRMALDRFHPLGRSLGDPRLGMTGIFLALSRVLPARYPLGEDLQTYLDGELAIGRLLDDGVITPRLEQLYAWSAEELDLPALRGLVHGATPSYAWDPLDADPWRRVPSRPVRAVRRLVPA